MKTIFLECLNGDCYPSIGWLEFTKFCEQSHIIDKFCDVGLVDRMFIAVNFEEEELDDNPDRELCRYEFMEILVRIADAKYKQRKMAGSFAQAFERVLKELFDHYNVPD